MMWGAVIAAAATALLHQHVYRCPGLASVRNSVVLITGSSSGIGAELAVQYGRLGAKLVLAARRQSQLEAVAEAARAAGAADVLAWPTDMADPAACESLMNATMHRFGRLDVLWLNHAIVDDALFTSHADLPSLGSNMLSIFKTNVVGSAFLTRLALPHLEATAGHIAVSSSGSAKVAAPFHSAYVSSKHALHGMFDTLRAELHLLGSRVTVGLVVIGMVATPEVVRDEALRRMASPVPDVAAEMLCAAQARWDHTYVPKWLHPVTQLLHLGGNRFAEAVMNGAYVTKVERYVAAIDAHKVRR